jgi:hypothetical protein
MKHFTHTLTDWKAKIRLLLSFMVCIFILKNSQAQENQNDTHYYYIEESSYDALKSTNIRENQDGTISLEFENESLTSFFENFTIYSYVREFEWSRFTSLHKYYLIELDETNKEASLLLNSNIITAEYAGTLEDIEGKPLDTPNDYFC